jgi:hypothetical protein
MRAKMRVSSVTSHGPNNETLNFNAVCGKFPYPADGSDEDNTFARWTPSASLQMQITNPELVGKYKQGDTFYVDFTPV